MGPAAWKASIALSLSWVTALPTLRPVLEQSRLGSQADLVDSLTTEVTSCMVLNTVPEPQFSKTLNMIETYTVGICVFLHTLSTHEALK